jgi:hypothetical protein
VVVVLATVLAPIGPACAAGPYDGVYTVTTSNASLGYQATSISVAVQDGSTLVVVNLFEDGTWDFGIGTFTGETTVTGTLYRHDGPAYGTFQITLAGGVGFSGQATFGGYTFAVDGTRVF